MAITRHMYAHSLRFMRYMPSWQGKDTLADRHRKAQLGEIKYETEARNRPLGWQRQGLSHEWRKIPVMNDWPGRPSSGWYAPPRSQIGHLWEGEKAACGRWRHSLMWHVAGKQRSRCESETSRCDRAKSDLRSLGLIVGRARRLGQGEGEALKAMVRQVRIFMSLLSALVAASIMALTSEITVSSLLQIWFFCRVAAVFGISGLFSMANEKSEAGILFGLI